ncbi:MAG: hypothetical protein COB36_11000 [Alphaproteobacteria bacterium]|nr:MAG: hypothetical protein COB36_11000 [Alphaproteobacteria bacterium]
MENEFLEQLAQLCEQYKASFSYTTDDDGIHIDLDGKEVFCGWLYQEGAAAELREAREILPPRQN